MRIPLAIEGTREMIGLTLLLALPAVLLTFLVIATVLPTWLLGPSGFLMLAWAGGIAFFRDPDRRAPKQAGLVAPADGRVRDIARVTDTPEIEGPATRIGIFLSIFDVHVNRSPCDGIVRCVRYRPGSFLDARHPDAGKLNECNSIVIEPRDKTVGPIIVRQIAGLVARRIVCNVKPGDEVRRGEKIGLIKFGSRTELLVSDRSLFEPGVQVDDKVRAGIDLLFTTARRSEDDPSTPHMPTAAGAAEV
jgi:phosphatidylserine decarboxylase